MRKLYPNLNIKKSGSKYPTYVVCNGDKVLTEAMRYEDAVDLKYRLSKIKKFR